jgi:hypothetical protein
VTRKHKLNRSGPEVVIVDDEDEFGADEFELFFPLGNNKGAEPKKTAAALPGAKTETKAAKRRRPRG